VEIENNVMVDLSLRRFLKIMEDGDNQEQVIAHNRVTSWKTMAIDKENESIAIFNKIRKLECQTISLYDLFSQHKQSATEALNAKRPLAPTEQSVEDPTVRLFNSKMRRIKPTQLSRPDLVPGYDIRKTKVYISISVLFSERKLGSTPESQYFNPMRSYISTLILDP
jgi:hypothetical protein